MKPGEITTVIGRSATFRGDLSSTDDLQIDGSFEGTVRQTSGRLTIGAEATVYASIVAPDVVVFGRLEGDIRATGRVDLRSTAVVLGDIFAGRLSMEENASLHGQVDPFRASETVPPVVAASTASVPPDATRSAFAAATGTSGARRDPDLFDSQTESPIDQSQQMPSAPAAVAAAARQDSSPEIATSRKDDEDGSSSH